MDCIIYKFSIEYAVWNRGSDDSDRSVFPLS